MAERGSVSLEGFGKVLSKAAEWLRPMSELEAKLEVLLANGAKMDDLVLVVPKNIEGADRLPLALPTKYGRLKVRLAEHIAGDAAYVLNEGSSARASDREPICGFCWAYRQIRRPLVFQPKKGYWECPLCLARVLNPETDEELLRQDLLRDYDPDPHRYAKTIASTLRLKGSGNKPSGRRRRKVQRAPRPRPLEEDQKLVANHNKKVQLEAKRKHLNS